MSVFDLSGKKGTFILSKPPEIQRDVDGSFGEEAPASISIRHAVSSPGFNWFWSLENKSYPYRLGCSYLKGLKARCSPGKKKKKKQPEKQGSQMPLRFRILKYHFQVG